MRKIAFLGTVLCQLLQRFSNRFQVKLSKVLETVGTCVPLDKFNSGGVFVFLPSSRVTDEPQKESLEEPVWRRMMLINVVVSAAERSIVTALLARHTLICHGNAVVTAERSSTCFFGIREVHQRCPFRWTFWVWPIRSPSFPTALLLYPPLGKELGGSLRQTSAHWHGGLLSKKLVMRRREFIQEGSEVGLRFFKLLAHHTEHLGVECFSFQW
mmetsp:Transcript_17871/g.20407  ORF Transcript_17871/g.20407 Transcript_17871/m.20407 type:complete len:213 (+) Transcript_17871:538-1176(+)